MPKVTSVEAYGCDGATKWFQVNQTEDKVEWTTVVVPDAVRRTYNNFPARKHVESLKDGEFYVYEGAGLAGEWVQKGFGSRCRKRVAQENRKEVEEPKKKQKKTKKTKKQKQKDKEKTEEDEKANKEIEKEDKGDEAKQKTDQAEKEKQAQKDKEEQKDQSEKDQSEKDNEKEKEEKEDKEKKNDKEEPEVNAKDDKENLQDKKDTEQQKPTKTDEEEENQKDQNPSPDSDSTQEEVDEDNSNIKNEPPVRDGWIRVPATKKYQFANGAQFQDGMKFSFTTATGLVKHGAALRDQVLSFDNNFVAKKGATLLVTEPKPDGELVVLARPVVLDPKKNGSRDTLERRALVRRLASGGTAEDPQYQLQFLKWTAVDTKVSATLPAISDQEYKDTVEPLCRMLQPGKVKDSQVPFVADFKPLPGVVSPRQQRQCTKKPKDYASDAAIDFTLESDKPDKPPKRKDRHKDRNKNKNKNGSKGSGTPGKDANLFSIPPSSSTPASPRNFTPPASSVDVNSLMGLMDTWLEKKLPIIANSITKKTELNTPVPYLASHESQPAFSGTQTGHFTGQAGQINQAVFSSTINQSQNSQSTPNNMFTPQQLSQHSTGFNIPVTPAPTALWQYHMLMTQQQSQRQREERERERERETLSFVARSYGFPFNN